MSTTSSGMHGTTILCVRKANQLAMIGDGQVTLGNTVVKPNANKLRKLPKFNICEKEKKKKRKERKRALTYNASLCLVAGFAGSTADAMALFERLESQLTGSGDVVEAHDGVTAVGSGSPIALGAARALIDSAMTAEEIAIKALKVTAEIDIYTNGRYVLHTIESTA
jgi:ATP-dependent HslUV protease subunit HslV